MAGRPKKKTEEETLTLEAAFEELESVISELERGEGSLEEAFTGYEKGMKLLKFCSSRIDKVEKQIQILKEEGGYDEL